MKPITEDITVFQGATWNPVLQWLSETPTHKLVSNVAVGLPTIVTALAHGITGTARVPVWITNVQGPRSLNTKGYTDTAPLWATVVDADTLAIDFDSGSLAPYAGGGVLTYRAPVDLTGWTATDDWRATYQSATSIAVLSTSAGSVVLGADGTIKRTLASTATSAMTAFTGVHILELTDPSGNVTRFAQGNVCVSPDFPQAAP